MPHAIYSSCREAYSCLLESYYIAMAPSPGTHPVLGYTLVPVGLCGAGERPSMGIGSLQRRSLSINIHGSSLSRGPSHQYSTPQVEILLHTLSLTLSLPAALGAAVHS